MLKVWNVVLVIITFFLTIFGTFMTRSGIVQSVHAFGQDNELALLFLIFMSVTLIISFGLLLFRLPALRAANEYESMLSREFVFLLNNILLLASAFFVLFATMFPTISEYVLQQRITVGPPFFNRFMVPLGLVLLFLTGVGPLFAWRKTSGKRLVDQFLIPVAATIVTVVALAIFWPPSRVVSQIFSSNIYLPVALSCFGLVAFVLTTIGQEFWRGMNVRRRQTGTDFLTALIGITFSKRRRYGGYLVHAGLAVMFFGSAGKAYQVDRSVTVSGPGESWNTGGYTFKYLGVDVTANDNRDMYTAHLELTRGADKLGDLYPARWHYTTGNQETTTEVDIQSMVREDVYSVLNGFDPTSKQANFTVYVNPFVNFVWLGFAILALGTAVCLFPMSLLGLGKRGGGGPAGAVVLILIAGLCGLGGGSARADTTPMKGTQVHEIVTGVVDDNANAPPVARRLFHDLVCLCGGCQRQTFEECPCAVAAKERQAIVGMLAGRDLSTPEKEQAAYNEIVAAYVQRFGGYHVLNVPPDTMFNRLAWAVPYAIAMAALLVILQLVRTWVRRGKAHNEALAAVRPSGTAASRSKYEEQLDDELDEAE